jgi:uncharacterized protein
MGAEGDFVRHWRTQKERYSLVGEICGCCGDKIFPPRDICPGCGELAKDLYVFSGKGTIYSFTKVTEAPEGHEEQAPYWIGMVKLEEGPLVTAQLTDFGQGELPEIGMEMEMVTRVLSKRGERGVIVYGYKFRQPMVEEMV